MNDQITCMGTKQYSVLTQEILEYFFNVFLVSENNNYATLESEGLKLIKTLFMEINEKDHKMQILSSGPTKQEHGTVSSSTGATLTSSSFTSNQNNKEFLIYSHPDELQGIETFWKIIMECNDTGVVAECIMFLDNIFHNISELIEHKRMEIEEDLAKKCIAKIDELKHICNKPPPEEDPDSNVYKLWKLRCEYAMKQIERFFLNIRSFMENSEGHGIGEILTHNVLSSLEYITIVINNKISYGQGCNTKKGNPRKFRLRIFNTFSLWRLKEYVAEKLELDPILIKIERIGMTPREFKESENAKTLKELGIDDNSKFSITTRMSSSMITKMNLLFSDGTLTPEAENLFSEVFYKYANEEGYMTRKSSCDFLMSCTSQRTDESDARIKRLFDNFDRDNDDLLTVEDFKDFYIDAIQKKESTVWANIRSWDYKPDLKQGSDRETRKPQTLLRYRLPTKKDFYSYFFSLLDEQYLIAKYSWELIIRLSVNPELIKKVWKFEDYDEDGQPKKFKFENMIDTNNPFQLLYLLHLIHYFLCLKETKECTAAVIFNEDDEDIPEPQSAHSNFMDTNLEVKGKGVTTGTSTQTNYDIPAPTPAVPLSVSSNSKRNGNSSNQALQGSTSGEGKATHVVSAGTQGSVPPPPPLPMGSNTMGGYVHPDDHVKFSSKNNKPKDEPTKYPSGGVMVGENSKEAEQRMKEAEDKPKSKESNSHEFQNYVEPISPPSGYLDLDLDTNDEWCLKFIELGGFQFMLNLFLSEDSFIAKKFRNIEIMTAEEKECVNQMITIFSIIITCANIATDSNLVPDVEIIKENKPAKTKTLGKELPKVSEDQEIDDIEMDEYEIDEQKLLENTKEPARERTISAIAREEDHKIKENTKRMIQDSIDNCYSGVVKALTGEYGDKILKDVPYDKFIHKALIVLEGILVKRNISENDKNIVARFNHIMLILFLFNEELLDHFYHFKDEVTGRTLKDILIKGLTYTSCSDIKTSFMNFITSLVQKVRQTQKVRLPIIVMLEITKEHFYESFKDNIRGYGYDEYYKVFSSLIHDYFEVQNTRNKKFENILHPKGFMSEIVNLLKKYKTKEKRNTMVEDH